MPLIHVQSLPFDPPLSIPEVITGVSADFASAAGVAEDFVSLSWHWLEPGHYSVGGVVADRQSPGSHPLLVQLLVPDFHTADSAARLLRALAQALARHTGVSLRNIFIELRLAHAGMVFDDGVVAEWR